MVIDLLLKQSGRRILKDKKTLLAELNVAKQANLTGDVFQIKDVLTREFDWDEWAEEVGVTPEVQEIVKKDQYWHLFGMLKKWAPARIRGNHANKVVISSNFNPVVNQLWQLIGVLDKANVVGGREVHHELGASDGDLLVGRQIHLAQTDILIFIESIVTRSDEFGDPKGELHSALIGSGFFTALIDYLTEQGCNKQGAAVLRRALERVSCTGKSDSKASSSDGNTKK